MSLPSVLTQEDILQFDSPPHLKASERVFFFAPDPWILSLLPKLKTPTTKIIFILQYGYFKASSKFFSVKTFRPIDLKYIAKTLNTNPESINLNSYTSRIYSHHKKIILAHLGWTPFKTKSLSILDLSHARSLSDAFQLAIGYLQKNQIEIPSYRTLAPLIAKPFDDLENKIMQTVSKSMTTSDKKSLDEFYAHFLKNYERFLTINQFLKPYQIQESLESFIIFKNDFDLLEEFFYKLSLSHPTIEYYAGWFQKAQLVQIRNLKKSQKIYLHLMCYLYHQYCLRQDYLVDTQS